MRAGVLFLVLCRPRALPRLSTALRGGLQAHMSRIILIQTELRDLDILTTCLEHLDCQVLHDAAGMQMPGAGARVQLLAQTSCGTVGFRLTAQGTYEFVGEDQRLARQPDFLKRLTQQYAYRKVMKEAKAAGYKLVQEEVGADQTIKLVVRKW